jgi:hypothetical protein
MKKSVSLKKTSAKTSYFNPHFLEESVALYEGFASNMNASIRTATRIRNYLQRATGIQFKPFDQSIEKVFRRGDIPSTYFYYSFIKGSLQVRFAFERGATNIPKFVEVQWGLGSKSPTVSIDLSQAHLGLALPKIAEIVSEVVEKGKNSQYLKMGKLDSGAVVRVLKPQEKIQSQPLMSSSTMSAQPIFNAVVKKTRKLKEILKETEDQLELVVDGQLPLLILHGDAGAGKTYTVTNFLRRHAPGSFYIKRGSVTPGAFFGLLYKFSDQILVMDDSFDTIAKDIQVAGALKAAANTNPEERIIEKESTRESYTPEGELVPPSFIFRGALIILTNYHVKDMLNPEDFGAINTRMGEVRFDVDPQSVLDYIGEIYKTMKPVGVKGRIFLTNEEKEKIFNWFVDKAQKKEFQSQKLGSMISIRAFETCIKYWDWAKDQKKPFEVWEKMCLLNAK